MSSIVELVFKALGTEAAAAAIKQVNAAIDEGARALYNQGILSVAATQREEGLKRVLAEHEAMQKKVTAASKEQASGYNLVNGSLTDVVSSLALFATAALAARKVYGELKDAIGSGATLAQLSLRTGESVRDLVIEEQAFKNAGLGANYLATAANLLDRALSPLNGNAKRNAQVFAELGVSMADLRGKGFGDQLQALSAGFARLPDQAARAEAAMQLFGRYAGGQMLQLFGDPQAIARATEQAGHLGDVTARNAQLSLELQQAWNGVLANLRTVEQEAAAQLLPVLKEIVDLLGKVQLGPLGAALGIGGVGLLGGGAMFVGLEQVIRALNGRLLKMEEGVAKSITRGASAAMADVAAWTPVGLAVLVTAQVVAGIVEAWADSRVQEALKRMGRETAPAAKARAAAAVAQTPEEWSKVVADTTRELQQRGEAIAALEAKIAAARSARDTSFAAGNDTAGTAAAAPIPGLLRDLDEMQHASLHLAAELAMHLRSAAAETKELVANQAKAFNDHAAALIANLPQIEDKLQKSAYAVMSPADQLADIARQRAELDVKKAAVPAGASDEAKKATLTDLQVKYNELLKQEEAANKKIAEEAKKAADEKERLAIYAKQTEMVEAQAAGDDTKAAKLKREIEAERALYGLKGQELDLVHRTLAAENALDAQKQAKEAAKETLDKQKRALENTLLGIRETLAKLDADHTRTEAEKWAEKKAAMEQEMAAVRAEIAKDEALQKFYQARGQPGDDTTAKLYGDSAAAGRGKLGSLQRESSGLGADPNSMLAQLQEKMHDVKQGFGTIPQTIAGGFGQAFQNASTGLQRLIGDTQLWSQRLGTIAGPIMGAITKGIADMFTTWITQEVLLAGLKKILHMEDKKDTKEATAGKALEAGFKSIATLGPLWGPIAFAASAAAIYALAGGFETGGFTGGIEGQPAGVVHGQEFVLSAPAVRNLGGPAAVAAMHSAARSAPAGFSSAPGGGNAGGNASQPSIHHWYFDRAKFRAALATDFRGIAHDVFDERMRKAS